MQFRLPRPLWLAVPTVVLVVVAASLGVGIPAHRQWSAVSEIRQYGQVEVRRVGPDWLRRLVGEDRMLAFDRIESVTFTRDNLYRKNGPDGPTVDDASLVYIRQFRDLKMLHLAYTPITDAGLSHLASLGKLEVLFLTGTDVTDAGVPVLRRMGNLKLVSLEGTRVSDAGAADLQKALPGAKVVR